MDSGQLTQITSDEDWLDLRQGEQGLVRGRLHGPLRTGQDVIIVSNVAWDIIAIAIPGGYAGHGEPAGKSITAVVERGEDGVTTTNDDIIFREDEE